MSRCVEPSGYKWIQTGRKLLCRKTIKTVWLLQIMRKEFYVLYPQLSQRPRYWKCWHHCNLVSFVVKVILFTSGVFYLSYDDHVYRNCTIHVRVDLLIIILLLFCRHRMGLIPTKRSLELCEKVCASSFCRSAKVFLCSFISFIICKAFICIPLSHAEWKLLLQISQDILAIHYVWVIELQLNFATHTYVGLFWLSYFIFFSALTL